MSIPWHRWPWAALYLAAVAVEFCTTWAKALAEERIKAPL